LGIHQIADISSEEVKDIVQLESLNGSHTNSDTIYKAHKALMSLNEKNLKVFSDVVGYLEQKKEE
jgi:hypothetical protein